MPDTAIRVAGLGKRYHLGGDRQPYRTVGDQLKKLASIRGLIRRARRAESKPPFWALKGVDFTVNRGEVVGVIGRNGAGKSTLLKILSRITEPTEGEVDIHGRVGSLLEVGTGFHPELTGRENVYLNGAILGMKRAEIVRRFDDIVAFAEIEKFIDTPVKHYSSGMYTRLAFAVAAHLEPDILIVDEVLAVGDAEFQKKCLGRMKDVAGQGRTVLFVSHQMEAVTRLCHRLVVLERGGVRFDGDVATGLTKYRARPDGLQADWVDDRASADRQVRLTAVRVRPVGGGTDPVFDPADPFVVEIEYALARPIACQVAFRLNRDDDETVFTTADTDVERVPFRDRPAGRHQATVQIPGHFLPPGRYHLLVAVNCPGTTLSDVIDRVLYFEVAEVGSLREIDRRLGAVTPLFPWKDESLGLG